MHGLLFFLLLFLVLRICLFLKFLFFVEVYCIGARLASAKERAPIVSRLFSYHHHILASLAHGFSGAKIHWIRFHKLHVDVHPGGGWVELSG